MSRLFLSLCFLALLGIGLGCERFDSHVKKFCTFAGEKAPCTKPNAYDTRDSQAVSDPSTNRAQRCLTCQIGRDGVLSTWYGPQSFASKCCNSANKCTSLEFPLNDVCCFTQECLNRCYPSKGHRTGTVY